jgi:hypothetical protein
LGWKKAGHGTGQQVRGNNESPRMCRSIVLSVTCASTIVQHTVMPGPHPGSFSRHGGSIPGSSTLLEPRVFRRGSACVESCERFPAPPPSLGSMLEVCPGRAGAMGCARKMPEAHGSARYAAGELLVTRKCDPAPCLDQNQSHAFFFAEVLTHARYLRRTRRSTHFVEHVERVPDCSRGVHILMTLTALQDLHPPRTMWYWRHVQYTKKHIYF